MVCMKKDKKYNLIWSLILITLGIILSILGYKLFPMISLIIVIGIFLGLYGLINLMKYF